MMNHFQEFLELLPNREDSERSWTVTREEIEAKNFDLKAVNLNTKVDEDKSTAKELLDFIEEKGKEVALTLSVLRKWER
jgi:type I restriction enzyme M protein